MKCTNIQFDKTTGRVYNCGKCHACRINDTSKWTVRCLFELNNWINQGCSFITLTYDDNHLPPDLGLHKEHLQDFWKRLRINLQRAYNPEFRILYRACGEYGEKEKKYITFTNGKPNGQLLGRPHYHAIVYGLDDLNDKHRQILCDSWGLCDPYMFDMSRKDNGMLPVCREDIAYVCGYTNKKLSGSLAKSVYGNRQPPFSATSQGLGLDFAIKNKAMMIRRGFVTLNGQKIGIPRYFRDKLGICQKELISVDKKFYADNNDVFAAFGSYLNSLGLSWLLDDPIKNSAAIERRWYHWYQKKQDEWSDFIMQEYLQKRSFRGNKI